MDGRQTIARCRGFENTLDLGPTLALGPQHGRTGQMARITMRQLLRHSAGHGYGAEGKLAHDQLLTNPDEAVKFVTETKVDALAIAMGTSHGAYKFTRKPDGDILAMNVIEEIHRKLPNMHLVMHGSSSVPEDLQE